MIALAGVLLLTTCVGLLLAVLGWMGMRGALPPNPLAGIRTRFTMSNEQAWYSTHRHGGPSLILGGVAGVAIGLALLPFALIDALPEAVIVTAIMVQALLALMTALISWLYGTRRAREELAASS